MALSKQFVQNHVRNVLVIASALAVLTVGCLGYVVGMHRATAVHATSALAVGGIGIFYPVAQPAFFLKNTIASGNADEVVTLGAQAMIPLAGDWNGDGIDSVGVYDPAAGMFYLPDQNVTGAPIVKAFAFGPPHCIPIAGDWTGQGYDTVGVYAPASGIFYLTNSFHGGNADISFAYGPVGSGYVPVAGDWTDQGRDTIGIYDSAHGLFYLKNTNAAGNADYAVFFGPPNAQPVIARYPRANGAPSALGIDSSGTFYFKADPTTTGYADIATVYGPANGIPVAGNWSNGPTVQGYPLPLTSQGQYAAASGAIGPDGNLWATAYTRPMYSPPVRRSGSPPAIGNNPLALDAFDSSGTVVHSYTFTSAGTGNLIARSDGLWFTLYTLLQPNSIEHYTTSGTATQFQAPSGMVPPGPSIDWIAPGADGDIWFISDHGNPSNQIGKLDPSGGGFTFYTIPTASSGPKVIVAGPDGNLWFTESSAEKIGRITTSGTFTEFSVPTANAQPSQIAPGPDGNLWFTESGANQVGRITTAGAITEYPLPADLSGHPLGNLAAGPDGNIWWTSDSTSNGSSTYLHRYGNVVTSANTGPAASLGTVIEYRFDDYGLPVIGVVSGGSFPLWLLNGEVAHVFLPQS